MFKKLRKRLAIVLATAMLTTSMTSTVLAQDLSMHWAHDTMTKWLEKGLLSGYEDGSYRPDKALTRAEFAELLTRMFGYEETDNATVFSDVPEVAWYADAVAAISHADLMYEVSPSFRPNESITREEAAFALANAYALSASSDDMHFNDTDNISEWAISQVKAMYTHGFIQGHSEGSFEPQGQLTRAEFITMADRMASDIVNTSGTYSRNVTGNLIVNTSGVILKDMVIEGNLYLAAGISEGDITLEGIHVKGDVIIEGGGENVIQSKNSTYEGTFIVSSENPVGILVQGDAVKLEAAPSTEVTLNGNFQEVIVSPDVTLQVSDATIDTIIIVPPIKEGISETAPIITMAQNSSVKNVQADYAVELKGDGKVEKLTVNAEGVSINKAPGEVLITDKGITVEIEGKKVKQEYEDEDVDSDDDYDYDDDFDDPYIPPTSFNYHLSGYIDFEDDGIENVSVHVFMRDEEGKEYDYLTTAYTDIEGYYNLELEAGKYYGLEAWFESSEGYGYHITSDVIYLNSNKQVNLELIQYPVVHFTVVDRNNVPIPDVKIVPQVQGEPDGYSYTNDLGQASRYIWQNKYPYGFNFYMHGELIHQIPEEVTVGESMKEYITVKIDTFDVDGNVRLVDLTIENPKEEVGKQILEAYDVLVKSTKNSDLNWTMRGYIEDGKVKIIMPQDFADESVDIIIRASQGEDLIQLTDVSFENNKIEKLIDLSKLPKYTICGNIHYTTEAALRVADNAEIDVFMNGWKNDEKRLSYTHVFDVRINEGNMQLDNLVPSRYTLRASYTTESQLYIGSTIIYTNDFDHGDINMDFILVPAVHATITFVDEEGYPLANKDVGVLYETAAEGLAYVHYSTDSRGQIYLEEGIEQRENVRFDIHPSQDFKYNVLNDTIKISDNMNHTFTVEKEASK